MPLRAENHAPIGRKTAVNLWTAAIIAVALGGWIVRDAIWKTKINSRLQSIESIVNDGVADRWTGSQMALWTALLQAENPDVTVPKSSIVRPQPSPPGR